MNRIKPGAMSTEWELVRAYSVAGASMLGAGFVAALFDWPGQVAGYVLMGLGSGGALVAYGIYVLGRAAVKRAAAFIPMPPKRVF